MTEANKEFQLVDTTVVQVRSVLNFMYALGYTLDTGGKSGRFVTELKEAQGNRHLSFASAAKMHNLPDQGWNIDQETGVVYPSCVTLASGFSAIGVRLAQASKLVKQVKMSVTKHGQVLTLDPMVVPLNKIVESLIGL